LADHKVDNPEEVVKVGEEIEVKVLRVDTDERKIGLSRKRVHWTADQIAAEAAAEGGSSENKQPEKPQQELKGGLGSEGPLFGSSN
jgi:small subunit ribosomal protein S1